MLPALYPFGTAQRWLEVAPAFFDETGVAQAQQLLEKGVIPVQLGPEIAIYLGVSPKLVSHMVIRPSRYYNTFEITKKNGSRRLITAPRVFLKTASYLRCNHTMPRLDFAAVAIAVMEPVATWDAHTCGI